MGVYFYWSGPDFDFSNYLAVSTAARHATDAVAVYTDNPPAGNPYFDALADLPGVTVRPIVLDELMSPAHADLYRRMRFVAHRSDLVRFCVLARYGGIYLDTDTVTTRSLADIGPRLLLKDDKIVHIGTMALAAGDTLAEQMLTSFLQMPDTDLDVYQSIVYRWTAIVRGAGDNVTFGDLSAYFPVHWKDWETIFQPHGFSGDISAIHILHHYGYFSRAYTANMDPTWVFDNPCLFSTLAMPGVADLASDRATKLSADRRQIGSLCPPRRSSPPPFRM